MKLVDDYADEYLRGDTSPLLYPDESLVIETCDSCAKADTECYVRRLYYAGDDLVEVYRYTGKVLEQYICKNCAFNPLFY
tara:strand:- start:1631 stop:1870 length:240 start_codon:yes stop_codon:yes gene_type:complete